MTFVRHYDKTDFYVKFTWNPKWKQIDDELFQYQKAKNRPDSLPVFHLKVKKFIDLVKNGKPFESINCDMYRTEKEKRWLKNWLATKIHSHEKDSISSEDFPNPSTDMEFYEMIKMNMGHDTCGRCLNQIAMTEKQCIL